MTDITTRLLTERVAWVPVPELIELLPEAARRFEEDVLGNIPWSDIVAGKYTWHHESTTEPDDGIIYKQPDDLTDPSIAVHGVRPDHKVFMQWRLRTEDMFRDRDLYQPTFRDFFRVMEELRWRLDRKITTLIAELREEWPNLGVTGHKHDSTVMRVMQYRGARSDGSGLAGKWHTDKNDVTLHLFDSTPGLLIERVSDQFELVETRSGQALAFLGDRFASLSGIPAVRHGARDNGERRVIVMFVHFAHANGS